LFGGCRSHGKKKEKYDIRRRDGFSGWRDNKGYIEIKQSDVLIAYCSEKMGEQADTCSLFSYDRNRQHGIKHRRRAWGRKE